MILTPSIMALIAGSLLLAFFAAYASITGVVIIRRWDIGSGSELQLDLERRTYLLSTILAYLMGLEVLSFFLFIYTADNLHHVFVGAMCAAGVLNVDGFGYPTLLLKIVNLLFCGVWLVLNHVDSQACDYPVVREKYRFLLVLAASLGLETYLQWRYFAGLKADIIVSCCGTLFSETSPSVAGELASLPSRTGKFIFFAGLYATLRLGVQFLLTGKGAKVFAWTSTGFLVVAGASLMSFIALYFYQLPTHHCPFCILQSAYYGVGYPLYATALLGGVTGAGVGWLQRFRDRPSLATIVPRAQRRLCLTSMLSFAMFTAISIGPMVFTDFRLEGY